MELSEEEIINLLSTLVLNKSITFQEIDDEYTELFYSPTTFSEDKLMIGCFPKKDSCFDVIEAYSLEIMDNLLYRIQGALGPLDGKWA